MRHTAILAAFALYCFGAAPALAQVEHIEISNPGFEADRLSDAGGQGRSWQFGVRGWTGERHGVFNVDVPSFPSGEAPEGRNVAFLSFADTWMSQRLDHSSAQPNRRYELHYMVGLRAESGYSPGRYQVQLFAGGDLLAEKIEQSPPQGAWIEDVLIYDAPENGAAGAFRITFRNLDARQINFDNVRLISRPAPERIAAPAAAALEGAPGGYADSFWFAQIRPAAPMEFPPGSPAAMVAALWERGAYLHLMEDGRVEYNWSEPTSYAHNAGDVWRVDGSALTIDFGRGGIAYRFDLDTGESPARAFSDNGGVFEMNMTRKQRGER
jgi:hypothetical protein